MAATEMSTYPRFAWIGGIFIFFAADGQPLRLAASPLPLYRRGDTEEDIAGSSLWFRSVALANTL